MKNGSGLNEEEQRHIRENEQYPVSLEWPEKALPLQSILKPGLENLGETHGSASHQGLDGKMPLPG